MPDNNVEIEAMQQAVAALGVYIGAVSNNIQKMKDAAVDCHDNMGKDVYSAKAIDQLNICITELTKTISKAEALKTTISNKIQEILDSTQGW